MCATDEALKRSDFVSASNGGVEDLVAIVLHSPLRSTGGLRAVYYTNFTGSRLANFTSVTDTDFRVCCYCSSFVHVPTGMVCGRPLGLGSAPHNIFRQGQIQGEHLSLHLGQTKEGKYQ